MAEIFAPSSPAAVAQLIGEYPMAWVVGTDFQATPLPLMAETDTAGAVVARLDDAVVLPRLRGRGIGHAMLEALFAELRRARFARVDLAVHRRNTGARRLYERLGFQQTGPYTAEPTPGAIYLRLGL